jgi:peptide chain release factor subunit 1
MVRIGEYATESFMPILEEKKLKGLLLGGPGNTKNEFAEKDYLHHELKKKIIDTFDLCYTEEFGIRELLDKASDLLRDIDLMKEKNLIQRFFKELIKDDGGLSAYGEAQVMKYLEMGAIDTLIVTEDIGITRVTVKCNNCDITQEVNVKTNEMFKFEEQLKTKACPTCGGAMYIDEEKDIIEYLSDLCNMHNTDLIVVSTDTEEGSQISRAFKGMAAILRYKL